jgi:hypothetical protein
LIYKTEGRKQIEKPRHRWMKNIKVNLKWKVRISFILDIYGLSNEEIGGFLNTVMEFGAL